MQCAMRCKSCSRGLDTVLPDLLGRRSLPYLDDLVAAVTSGSDSLPGQSMTILLYIGRLVKFHLTGGPMKAFFAFKCTL